MGFDDGLTYNLGSNPLLQFGTEEVILANAYPVECNTARKLLGESLLQVFVHRDTLLATVDSSREETHIIEHIGIALRYLHSVEASHR